MGDVITRFKLETTQYDSKLRDATNGLKEVIHQTELAGNDFKEFSSRAIEAARALGQQATGATNAKDKVKELVSSYNEMAKTYNLMSDAMKKSEGGKALAASLEQLQQRIKDAKAEMNETPGVLDNLASKFTVNIDAIKLFNVGLQAAEGVLNVAKDAFFKNEEQLDEWGRIVESSKSLYSGFLDALNTGDISGYLNRIGEITKAAQNAYNALDALNTFNAFNQVNVEKTRTGMTESIVDYRSGQGSKEQVKSAGEAYQKELRERQKLERKAYLEAIKKVAAERGVNGQDLITALSGSYGSYESLKALPMSGTRMKFTPGGMFGGSTAYEEAYPVNRQEKLGAALRKLNDTELQSLQALGAQAERTGNEIAQVDKQLTRVLNGRQPGLSGSGGSGGSSKTNLPEYADFSKLLFKNGSQDLQAEAPFMSVFSMMKGKSEFDPENILGSKDAWEEYKNTITGTVGSVKESFDNLTEWTTDFDPFKEKMDDLTKTAKQNQMVMSLAGQAVNSFSAALAGMEDPGVKAAGIVMQSLASIALGFAQAAASPLVTGTGWGWLAFVAAGLGAMATAISTVHSLTGYAQGGIVEGNSYSGDNMMFGGDGLYGLNAGELVLTKSQQNSLAQQLSGNGMGNINVSGRISGTDILLSADRAAQASGRGQLVTWK